MTLSRGALELLNSMITTPGWSDKRRFIHAGGGLAHDIDEHVFDRPVYDGPINEINGQPTNPMLFRTHQLTARTWERQQKIIVLSDLQYQSCTAAICHFTEDKKLGGSQFTSELLTAFKLTE